MPSETVVVSWIDRTMKVPEDLKALVSEYRKLAEIMGEQVSYPISVSKKADAIFDALIVMV